MKVSAGNGDAVQDRGLLAGAREVSFQGRSGGRGFLHSEPLRSASRCSGI